MERSELTILVTGATGNQGGASARHLLKDGWRVRALTRTPSSTAAQALRDLGAEVVQGDFDDRDSIDRALDGVWGVFSVQGWREAGAEGEERRGITLAEVAADHDISHFVYSSVGGAERHTGIPHFESKWHIEERIRELGLPATIWRPVSFMENYKRQRETILAGTYSGYGLPPDKTLQLIAVDDIGGFVALSFAEPERFIGTATEIAGDELTEDEIAETFARVIGRPVELLTQPPPAGQRETEAMARWFYEDGYDADIPALRTMYPPLTTLETYLRANGWANAR